MAALTYVSKVSKFNQNLYFGRKLLLFYLTVTRIVYYCSRNYNDSTLPPVCNSVFVEGSEPVRVHVTTRTTQLYFAAPDVCPTYSIPSILLLPPPTHTPLQVSSTSCIVITYQLRFTHTVSLIKIVHIPLMA